MAEEETLKELAERLEIEPVTARSWRKRFPDFPSSISGRFGAYGAQLYRTDEIEAWRKLHDLPSRIHQQAQRGKFAYKG